MKLSTETKMSQEQKLEIALRDVYETISTDGMNKVTPGGANLSKSLANRRQDHRFLVFKDAEINS